MSSQVLLSSKPACQLLAKFSVKEKGLPRLETDFYTCRSREQAKLSHGRCFSLTRMRNTYFTEIFRPLTVGEKSPASLHLIHPFSHYSLHFC